jgi:hypothetical protein
MVEIIHQCPRCELRFLTESELMDHLAVDHDPQPLRFPDTRDPAAPADG